MENSKRKRGEDEKRRGGNKVREEKKNKMSETCVRACRCLCHCVGVCAYV